MPHPNAAQLQDKVIEVEPSYAPAAWHVLLPRLVDLATPELYAFSSYNAERRGLALRTLKVVGPTRFGGSGGQTAAIKLEDSEGLIPPITETDVDSKGNILRIIAGGLEMLATTREHVEQTYASRVKAAQEVIKKLPIKEPTPAVRQRPMDPAAPHIVQPPPERR